jgi:hypothetical protein
MDVAAALMGPIERRTSQWSGGWAEAYRRSLAYAVKTGEVEHTIMREASGRYAQTWCRIVSPDGMSWAVEIPVAE